MARHINNIIIAKFAMTEKSDVRNTASLLIFLALMSPGSNEFTNVPGSAALSSFPVIDGHNDLAWTLLKYYGNKLENFNFDSDLTVDPHFQGARDCHTDLPRLRKGRVGGQFWAAYVDCDDKSGSFVPRTLAQIDVIIRLIQKYSDDLKLVVTADGIIEAINEGKIASMIGVEGGHSIENSLAVLRMYYDLGVRYMTLTHTCSLDWVDASPVDSIPEVPKKNLTAFGKAVLLEMNRLGMMIDLSHVSYGTMLAALEISKAPVIFSHSSAKAIVAVHRNVPDDVLQKVAENRGIVMVNFYPRFIGSNATLDKVVDHINHIAKVSGVDHIGLGADFNGILSVTEGLEDVSKYPDLFDRLKESDPDKWTSENLQKLAGKNIVRVFKEVEKVRDKLVNEHPREDTVQA